ncbi:MAG: glycoside hydrolase family 88 protein [Verrucomicrobiota bacterium]
MGHRLQFANRSFQFLATGALIAWAELSFNGIAAQTSLPVGTPPAIVSNRAEVEEVPAAWQADGRLVAFRKRLLLAQPSSRDTGWLDVLVAQGAAQFGLKLRDESLLRWATAWADFHLAVPLGTVVRSGGGFQGIRLDDACANWGAPFVLGPLYLKQQNRAYLAAIRGIADHILDNSPRAPDCTITHAKGWGIWVDSLYYTASPLAHAFEATGDKRYAEEAVRQCLLHAKHLRDEKTGLFHHDKNLSNGQRTPGYWGRGNGWMIMSLVDTLRLVPQETEGYGEVLSIYRSQAEGLLKFQHESGMWRMVPEEPSAPLETSGTTMILFGLAAGINEGWISESNEGSVRRGFKELVTWINPQGQLMGSQGVAGCGGWETHKLSPIGESAYTTGVFFKLMAEMNQGKLGRTP